MSLLSRLQHLDAASFSFMVRNFALNRSLMKLSTEALNHEQCHDVRAGSCLWDVIRIRTWRRSCELLALIRICAGRRKYSQHQLPRLNNDLQRLEWDTRRDDHVAGSCLQDYFCYIRSGNFRVETEGAQRLNDSVFEALGADGHSRRSSVSHIRWEGSKTERFRL